MSKKIAFLIEGLGGVQADKVPHYQIQAQEKIDLHNTNSETRNLPNEVGQAYNIAIRNKAEVFDSIVSFSPCLYLEFFKQYNKSEHQKITYLFMSIFANEMVRIHSEMEHDLDNLKIIKNSIQSDINETFIPTFKLMIKEGTYKSLPNWLKNFSIQDFSEKIITYRHEAGSMEEYNKLQHYYFDTALKLSNQISANTLLQYINDRNEINEIYGLIGEKHLSMIDGQSKIIEENDSYKHLKLVNNDREVDIHLFGGTHADYGAYDQLKEFVSKQGLIMPCEGLIECAYETVSEYITKFLGISHTEL